MPDNTPLNPTYGGDTIRSIDRGQGYKTQVLQLDIGGASANRESLVSVTNPVPMAQTFQGVIVLIRGLTVPPARAVGVNCFESGDVEFRFPDFSSITLPVDVGWTIFPFACIQI